MIQNLGNRMEKILKTFNKDLEELKSKETEMNNTINEILNSLVKREEPRCGVERHALTPSCENTRITTSCWTIINRKILEFTKKDTPHPKTKEKPQ